MKKGETKLKESVLPRLRALESSWWVKIQQRTIRGIPDILGVVNGQFVAIELKNEATLEELQKVTLSKIGNAGGVAVVLTPENCDAIFQQLEKFTMPTYGIESSKVRIARKRIMEVIANYKNILPMAHLLDLEEVLQKEFDELLHSEQEYQEKTPR